MNELGNVLKELRGKESLREAAKRIGISHTYLDTIEKGHDKRSGKPIKPTPETLKLAAAAYDYSYNQLMKLAGYIEDDQLRQDEAQLTEKDEKDIAKRIESMRKDLIEGRVGEDGLHFMGEPMSEEAIESLIDALEYAERQATRINKKYIPKKYRKENE